MNDDPTQQPKRRLLDDRLRQVRSSSSVLVFSDDPTRPDDLLKWADAAMYQAKEEGRNRVHLFEKSA
ncbi:MAG: diguanylate cyclase [Rhodoferax sp.]|uniref:diguanylate cyclase domain-containing protein n=1 Tax=Rhodoferax sp. TaxID=50421 RepID=UPI003BAFB15A